MQEFESEIETTAQSDLEDVTSYIFDASQNLEDNDLLC